MTKRSPFRYFKTSPEIIHLAVMMYVCFPLSLRNFEDLLQERGIDISHETVRFWWNRFGPLFAAEIRKKRVSQMRAYSKWQWHLDEVFVKINGETHYLWRAVDHERGSLGLLFYQAPRPQGRHEIPTKKHEALREPPCHRERQTPIVRRCNEINRQCAEAGNLPLDEHLKRAFTSAVSTTITGFAFG